MLYFQEKVLPLLKKYFALPCNLFEREYSARTLALLFLLAIAIGSSIKALVNDSLTIGFDDYKISTAINIVDLNDLEKQLIKNRDTSTKGRVVPTGEVCTEGEE